MTTDTKPQCKTCKFWSRGMWITNPNKTSIWLPTGMYECHLDNQEVGECQLTKIDGEPCFLLAVGDGIYQTILTDANFGYIKHMPITE